MGNITRVPGFRVGQETDSNLLTGCTVILAPPGGAVAGVDLRGGAPATRELGLLRPEMLVERVHAIYLSGGSAWGLDGAGGVMDFLAENDIGFATGGGLVPLVPGAAIFDLEARERAWPDRKMAYRAAEKAHSESMEQGNVGAGTGATLGKAAGTENMMKGGLGSAAMNLPGGAVAGALAVVNPLGEVRDPDSGEILAGVRGEKGFLKTRELFLGQEQAPSFNQNTVLGVVATDCFLTPSQATRVAQMAHDGLARAVYPAHTMLDGDIIFVLAGGKKETDINILGMVAADLIACSIVRGVQKARSTHGIPAWQDFRVEK